jgi:hypothetical protein
MTTCYIKGENDPVADTLSRARRYTGQTTGGKCHDQLITKIRKDYMHDSWCKSILGDLKRGVIDAKFDIKLRNGFETDHPKISARDLQERL